MTLAQFVTIPAGAPLADYSSQSVVAAVCASPFVGAARYTRPINPGLMKWLVPAERDTLHAARKAVVLVYESFQTRPLAGYNAGVADATAAAAFGYEIDYPAPGVIMAAVDINTIRAGQGGTVNVEPIRQYLRGYAEQLAVVSSFRPGVYGDWEAIDAAGPASALNWQMGARSFSPLGIHPAADLLQYPESWVGHGLDHYDGPHSSPGIDSNVCLRAFPAWLPHDTPAPPPANPKEETMYLAQLNDGTIVVVGSAVRPVSIDEIDPGGPLAGLPKLSPPPGSNWHAWLVAGADEYAARVMGPGPAPAPVDVAAIATAVYDRLAAARVESVGHLV